MQRTPGAGDRGAEGGGIVKAEDERAMHELAVRLVELTEGTCWEAMRYWAIGRTLEQISEYCATCECQARRNRAKAES